jgi:hypothetical protein
VKDFLTLTTLGSTRRLMVGARQIVSVEPHFEPHLGTQITTISSTHHVAESFDQVQQMLEHL